MQYKPKARKKGIKLPFGYYLNPLDPNVLIPDPKKLDALHYAFRMKAKYNTSLRDCVMWLQSATGDRMSAHGFGYLYKQWIRRLQKERSVEIAARRKAHHKSAQEYIDKNFKHLEIIIDEDRDITAVAEAKQSW